VDFATKIDIYLYGYTIQRVVVVVDELVDPELADNFFRLAGLTLFVPDQ
jgi:hypothetical protein